MLITVSVDRSIDIKRERERGRESKEMGISEKFSSFLDRRYLEEIFLERGWRDPFNRLNSSRIGQRVIHRGWYIV